MNMRETKAKRSDSKRLANEIDRLHRERMFYEIIAAIIADKEKNQK